MPEYVYSVYCKVTNTTQLLSNHGMTELLMRTDLGTDKMYDIIFAVEEYGPQMAADRYLITRHDLKGLR